MVRTVETLLESVDALAAVEPAFASVLEQHGRPEPRKSDPGAITLLRTIVGQQVSVAAARAMWRVYYLIAQVVLCGMSMAK